MENLRTHLIFGGPLLYCLQLICWISSNSYRIWIFSEELITSYWFPWIKCTIFLIFYFADGDRRSYCTARTCSMVVTTVTVTNVSHMRHARKEIFYNESGWDRLNLFEMWENINISLKYYFANVFGLENITIFPVFETNLRVLFHVYGHWTGCRYELKHIVMRYSLSLNTQNKFR